DRAEVAETSFAEWAEPEPPAWQVVQARLGLSAFERDVLLLCAGVELSSRLGEHCERLAGELGHSAPTFGMALAFFDEPHWSALAPDRPLRRWKLVELDGGRGLTTARLRIDEHVLHVLAGHHVLDDRLRDLVLPLDEDVP